MTDFRTAIFQPLTLPWRLGRFLAGGPGLDDIPAQMRQALETREERFLRIMETRVYACETSPYRRLLERVGCEFADVHDLTRRHGLEGYPADELIEVLELRLPAAFGGGPSDYQLVEEEDERGPVHLTLRIHPRLGELDETRVLAHFISAIGSMGENQRFVAESWRGRGTFRVARLAPRTSARGKMMSVHLGLDRTDEADAASPEAGPVRPRV